ncbi:acylneuraminate cytidylyltransferase family protein [bacterium]|jgi:CMP-N,N'-diacetyllegionaminic acid synthase|nr:acylneuraminate cytidylyltransferase family protein [bacterium]
MYKDTKFIAIIPARGGSKRLPRKNILNLNGKPLIGWTIEAALKSKYIDEVMVTTDDDEIIDISKKIGAKVPFKRPAELSDDTSLRPKVIKHTLDYYKHQKEINFDYLIYLQPTSPLRTSDAIDKAIEYMFKKQADAVISVCKVEHPLHWSGSLPDNKDMKNFLSSFAIRSRSQDLEKNFRLNGAIYICDVRKFYEQSCIFLKENIFAYEMSQDVSVDIDTKIDFLFADFLMGIRY